MNLSAVRRYFEPAAPLLILLGSSLFAQAQSIRIELVNGRNGRPIANTCVNAWVGTERKDAMAIPTDKDGIARLYLTDKDTEINTRSQWGNCGLFGVLDPVVRHSDTIAVNAGYVLCETRKSDYSWLAIRTFATAEVLQHGIVMANTCGKAMASPQAGEIIIYVRPLTWWEKFRT